MGIASLTPGDGNAVRLETMISDRGWQKVPGSVLEVLRPKLRAKRQGTMDRQKGMRIS